ncbi:hypothetical protein M1771_05695 [Spiroplasma citri]|uniref:Site-specific DNA-methyltransferase n=1 Tax=Spiroplasma citri TaxID=2133 RepID=A0AAX3SWA4_SPICI|nr:hypothetical protein [Spiroplasma citri]WFG95596.1 hypothetical protein M0C40_05730 [Spiroplasma citri]WFG99484.1 hypothetical protein M1771_05695 [Spiroplasma citri]
MKTNLGELYLGDSLEILKKIPDKSIDLILTDPPYLYPDIAKKLENKEKSWGFIKNINKVIKYKLK